MPILRSASAGAGGNLTPEISTSFFFLKAFFLFFHRIFSRKFRTAAPGIQRNVSLGRAAHRKFQKFPSLAKRPDLSDQTLVFDVEGALLKPSSHFSYFMLVAFEAGSLLRAAVLLLSYPLIRLVGRKLGFKIMVMISFFGIKRDTFRIGSSVLPKFFLNDVGFEAFEVLKNGGKRVGLSNFPQVMIESFLKDYLEIEVVVGRELKVINGYFVGLMEDRRNRYHFLDDLKELEDDEQGQDGNFIPKKKNIIGITGYQKGYDFQFLSSICNEIYLVSESEKSKWQSLPRDKFPKPLIFHDGRLALNPSPSDALAVFVWFPFGFSLAILRALVSIFLPHHICIPINAFTGMRLTVSDRSSASRSQSTDQIDNGGLLYVCNHRTLLDPIYISIILGKRITAVTYSLSKASEFISPIRTVRLTRNRDRDAEMMKGLLEEGDLIVCPEGTTCREPYLLRFSPLFSEIGSNIVPVANDTYVSMFHGTTAGGLKCLDPLFFLMNPSPAYAVQMLETVSGSSTSRDDQDHESRRFDVANRVQSEIAGALKFECTKLTRRDKYLILAGNEGISSAK